MSEYLGKPYQFSDPKPVTVTLSLVEWCELISAIGNAHGFIQAYLLNDKLTDYQRDGANWILSKLNTQAEQLVSKGTYK